MKIALNKLYSSPLSLVFCGLVLTLFAQPLYIPDSYEQGLGWLCRFQENPICTDINVNFRPPAMSFALAPFVFGMSVFISVGVASMLSASWMLFPLAHSLRTHFNPTTMWIGIASILFSPPILFLLSLADARGPG